MDGGNNGNPISLLEVENLSVIVKLASGERVDAVDKVSFSVGVGETLALVGESGAGKSLTAMALMRLHKAQFMDVVADRIDLQGRDIVKMNDREIRKIRGSTIAMIFQDPLTALNPVLTVERQLVEAILLHNNLSRAQARQRALNCWIWCASLRPSRDLANMRTACRAACASAS